MWELVMYTDGSIAGGNPGGHAVGAWVAKSYVCRGIFPYMRGTIDLGTASHLTNNIAEYAAVKEGLSKIAKRIEMSEDKPSKIIVRSDSKLVVNQVNDEWDCKVEHLKKFRDDIWLLCDKFECDVEFMWISRKLNEEADELSRSLYG